MRKLMVLTAALAAFAVASPDAAFAQKRGEEQGRHKVVKQEKHKVNKGDRRDDDRIRVVNLNRGSGKGPKFCRNGEGHPVHGRQWCVEKGFGLGNATWRRAVWDDVILRQPRPRSNLELGRDILVDVLGRTIYNRLDARRSTFGVSDPLTGRWIVAEGGRNVLFVTAGPTPIAELVDTNNDRRVDLVLLNYR